MPGESQRGSSPFPERNGREFRGRARMDLRHGYPYPGNMPFFPRHRDWNGGLRRGGYGEFPGFAGFGEDESVYGEEEYSDRDEHEFYDWDGYYHRNMNGGYDWGEVGLRRGSEGDGIQGGMR